MIAAQKLNSVKGPIWSCYDTGADIAEFVLRCKAQIEAETFDLLDKTELWRIFAPTCDWDDVVGDFELGNDVFGLLNHLYRQEILNSDKPSGQS